MSKNAKILMTLVSLALLLVLYLIFSSNKLSVAPENKNNEQTVKSSQIDLVKMKDEYQSNVKDIFTEMENIYSTVSLTEKATGSKEKLNATSSEFAPSTNKLISAVIGLRERLANLKVPEEYKNLHLKLVLLLNKIEDYFKNEQTGDEQKNDEMFKQIEIDNPWLTS